MQQPAIDINCDLGEGKTLFDCEKDAALMPYISRCNVTCGQHAGNLQTIDKTLENAARYKVRAGAHPGYPDREHFGRISQALAWFQLEDSILQQMELVAQRAASQGVALSHVKLHGALYNDTEQRSEQARRIAGLVKKNYPNLAVLGLANGCLEQACEELGIEFIREGFMDRRYMNSGQLSPRDQDGAVIEDAGLAVQQALQLVTGKPVTSLEGGSLVMQVDSICLHGDNPNVLKLVQQLVEALQQQGVAIR